ncbi:MAG: hypothetical protein U5K73_04715 [Halofilum sp. (in: g-proteobacteria)]|nr:hypothetical protein [Halofilum sp. (in: g-proteobacteria)]
MRPQATARMHYNPEHSLHVLRDYVGLYHGSCHNPSAGQARSTLYFYVA